MYVAMTRAKSHLCVVGTDGKSWQVFEGVVNGSRKNEGNSMGADPIVKYMRESSPVSPALCG